MTLYINALFALILVFFCMKYSVLRKPMIVSHPFNAGEKYKCNSDLSFMIFSVVSAMVFLGPLSLAKYALWVLCMGIQFVHWNKRWSVPMTLYMIFIAWNLYTLTYTQYMHQGVMMLVKYSLPVLFFWLGYNAITNNDDLFVFFKKVTFVAVVYSFMIGGLPFKVFRPLYDLLLFKSDNLFISYASLSDFYAVLFCVPVILYLYSRRNRYAVFAGLLLLSPILFSVRTGIAAIILSVAVFEVYFRRSKSLPILLIISAFFLIIFLFIPEVRDKSLAESGMTITTENVKSFDVKVIDTNGRQYIWDLVLETCYEKSPIIGSGCGTALGWLKERYSFQGGIGLIHSDWVQMLAETGLIGLSLYIIFAIVLLGGLLVTASKLQYDKTIVVLTALVASSFAACFLCMGFDNVVTYAQQAYVYPFLLYGVYLKVFDLKRAGAWS